MILGTESATAHSAADLVKPWYRTDHRVMGNPFTPMGEAYCTHCKEWGAAKAEGAFEGSVYAMKEWCARCGAIINFAVWDAGADLPKRRRARLWTQEPGPDRSGGIVMLPGKE